VGVGWDLVVCMRASITIRRRWRPSRVRRGKKKNGMRMGIEIQPTNLPVLITSVSNPISPDPIR
jgi:hypothetical protein